jgi:alkylhydroperoxidase family enzyme
MPRLPYPDAEAPGLEDLVGRIRGERGKLLDLYHLLLHSPAVAEGWLGLMTAVRQKTDLPGALRELVILRIGWLNAAPYEVAEHVPIALAEGLTPEQVEAAADWPAAADLFSEPERLALAVTDQLTRGCRIDDETWRAAEAVWPLKSLVELVATVCAYNMVSRFLGAVRLETPTPAEERGC